MVQTRQHDSWTPWFAWHPVFIEGRLRWLERVERTRRYPEATVLHPRGAPALGPVWVYRLPIDNARDDSSTNSKRMFA